MITDSEENACNRLESGQGRKVADYGNGPSRCTNNFEGRSGWHSALEIESERGGGCGLDVANNTAFGTRIACQPSDLQTSIRLIRSNFLNHILFAKGTAEGWARGE